MRTFFRDHWKAIVLIVVLVLLATVTLETGGAAPAGSTPAAPRQH